MHAKVYKGHRVGAEDGRGGDTIVAADDRPLPLYLGVMGHSPTGFEWGYSGSGPAQLALAIVCDALGVDPRAKMRPGIGAEQPPHIARAFKVYQSFKARAVARWGRDRWEISRAEVLALIDAIDPPAGVMAAGGDTRRPAGVE